MQQGGTCKGACHHETAQILGLGNGVRLCHDHDYGNQTEIREGGVKFSHPRFDIKRRKQIHALYDIISR